MNDTRFYMKEDSKSSVTGLTTYQIIEAETEQIILETKSINGYVAVYVRRSLGDGKWKVQFRFGREDLIGKGDSKFCSTHPDVYLARLRSNDNPK